jgi:hypothetical protein
MNWPPPLPSPVCAGHWHVSPDGTSVVIAWHAPHAPDPRGTRTPPTASELDLKSPFAYPSADFGHDCARNLSCRFPNPSGSGDQHDRSAPIVQVAVSFGNPLKALFFGGGESLRTAICTYTYMPGDRTLVKPAAKPAEKPSEKPADKPAAAKK